MRKKVIGMILALTLSTSMLGMTACVFDDEDYNYVVDDENADDEYDDLYDEDEDYEDEDYEDEEYADGEEYGEESGEDENSGERGYLPDEIEDTWSIDYDGVIYSYKLVDYGTYGTWYAWTSDQSYNASGDIEINEGVTGYEVLLYTDADSYIYLFYGEDCGMIDREDNQLVRDDEMEHPDYGDPLAKSKFEIPEDYEYDSPITFIIGTWAYMGYAEMPQRDDTYYGIYEDGTFTHFSADDQEIESGTYHIDSAGDGYSTSLYFTYDDGREEEFRILLSNAVFIEDPDRYCLFRLEDFQ